MCCRYRQWHSAFSYTRTKQYIVFFGVRMNVFVICIKISNETEQYEWLLQVSREKERFIIKLNFWQEILLYLFAVRYIFFSSFSLSLLLCWHLLCMLCIFLYTRCSLLPSIWQIHILSHPPSTLIASRTRLLFNTCHALHTHNTFIHWFVAIFRGCFDRREEERMRTTFFHILFLSDFSPSMLVERE